MTIEINRKNHFVNKISIISLSRQEKVGHIAINE